MEVHGEVTSGFEAVREAFEANFIQHGEVGAAFALYVKGRKVVDIWGGVTDEQAGTPWQENTLQLVFSTTKGVTSTCAHLASQRGELDLDAPVTDYWPEFGAEGKSEIPVRWLLSHKAGLPVIDAVLTPQQAFQWDPVIEALAAQKPVWEPGTAYGYHALTFGWLVGEVIKRATGRSIGRYLREEISDPLGLDLWIGLPVSEESRVSQLVMLQTPELPAGGGSEQMPDNIEQMLENIPKEMRELVASFMDPNSLMNRALFLTTPPIDYNSREAHAAEIPAAGGITTARSLAKIYAAQVGEVDGTRILEPETVSAAVAPQSEGGCEVLKMPLRFSSGYFLNSSFAPLLSESSFGHAGAGGSLGFADVDAEVGFGYVMNKMQQGLAGDPRANALVDAVRRSL